MAEQWFGVQAAYELKRRIERLPKKGRSEFEDNLLEGWQRYRRKGKKFLERYGKSRSRRPAVRFLDLFLKEMQPHFSDHERWEDAKCRISILLLERALAREQHRCRRKLS